MGPMQRPAFPWLNGAGDERQGVHVRAPAARVRQPAWAHPRGAMTGRLTRPQRRRRARFRAWQGGCGAHHGAGNEPQGGLRQGVHVRVPAEQVRQPAPRQQQGRRERQSHLPPPGRSGMRTAAGPLAWPRHSGGHRTRTWPAASRHASPGPALHVHTSADSCTITVQADLNGQLQQARHDRSRLRLVALY